MFIMRSRELAKGGSSVDVGYYTYKRQRFRIFLFYQIGKAALAYVYIYIYIYIYLHHSLNQGNASIFSYSYCNVKESIYFLTSCICEAHCR